MVHTITYSYSCTPDGPQHVEVRLSQVQPPADDVRASFFCAYSTDRPEQNLRISGGDALFALVQQSPLPPGPPRAYGLDGIHNRLEIQCGPHRAFYDWWGDLPDSLQTLTDLVQGLEQLLADHLPRATRRRNRVAERRPMTEYLADPTETCLRERSNSPQVANS